MIQRRSGWQAANAQGRQREDAGETEGESAEAWHSTRGELLSRACRYGDGVTWSILLDSETKATLYLTEVKPPAEGGDRGVLLCTLGTTVMI